MTYLTAPELADLLECKPNQFALMERRLKAMGWAFTRPPGGCPKVLRAYHDRQLSDPVPTIASNDAQMMPNRAALEALQHGRKNKAA